MAPIVQGLAVEILVVPHVGTYAVLLLRKGRTRTHARAVFAGVELEPLERTK